MEGEEGCEGKGAPVDTDPVPLSPGPHKHDYVLVISKSAIQAKSSTVTLAQEQILEEAHGYCLVNVAGGFYAHHVLFLVGFIVS